MWVSLWIQALCSRKVAKIATLGSCSNYSFQEILAALAWAQLTVYINNEEQHCIKKQKLIQQPCFFFCVKEGQACENMAIHGDHVIDVMVRVQNLKKKLY